MSLEGLGLSSPKEEVHLYSLFLTSKLQNLNVKFNMYIFFSI